MFPFSPSPILIFDDINGQEGLFKDHAELLLEKAREEYAKETRLIMEINTKIRRYDYGREEDRCGREAERADRYG